MVATQKTLDALKAIGLNKYERNIWVALLSRGSSTAGELSDISNVPRSRCYDVLESLADRGFVVLQPGKPMKYVAIHPRESLERAKKKVLEEADEMTKKMDRLIKSEHIKELEKLHRDNIKTMQPEDMTGTLKGRYAMLQHTETMFRNAKKYVKLLTTDAGLAELAENHTNIMKKASESGVKIRIVAPVRKNTEIAREISKFAEVRVIENPDKLNKFFGRVCVIDGNEIIMGLTDDEKTHPTQDMAFWTQSSHVAVNFFEPVFDMVWTNSKPMQAK